MLNIVVKMDEPVKEELRVKNIKEFFENKNKQKATEDLILKLLYEAKGDLLNDETLIQTLQKSKIEGIEIEEKIAKQEQDRELFNVIRENYREAAFILLFWIQHHWNQLITGLQNFIFTYTKKPLKIQITPKKIDLKTSLKNFNFYYTQLFVVLYLRRINSYFLF